MGSNDGAESSVKCYGLKPSEGSKVASFYSDSSGIISNDDNPGFRISGPEFAFPIRKGFYASKTGSMIGLLEIDGKVTKNSRLKMKNGRQFEGKMARFELWYEGKAASGTMDFTGVTRAILKVRKCIKRAQNELGKGK